MPRLLNMSAYHYKRGGSYAVYLEHAEMFEKKGWDIAFFAMHHPNNLDTYWSKYFTDEIELGNKYSFLNKLKFAQEIIYSSDHAKKIGLLLNEFPADIAHVHGIYHHISANVYKTLHERGVRIVLTAHDLKLLCPAYRMHDGKKICEKCNPNALYNCVLNKCVHNSYALSSVIALESATHRLLGYYKKYVDKIVCPSKFYLKKHIEWGWPREKLAYIPNDFSVPPIIEIPQPGDYLCYFGRLSFEKGLTTVVKSAAQAGISLHVLGEGPQENELRNLAEKIGANVVFHGRQSGEDLFRIVRGARACVLASEWYENAPKSILESFGLGKIVIGADIGGISEMILDGKTGFLFPHGNIDALTKVLVDLKSMNDFCIMQMGRRALQFVQEEFTSEKYLFRMENLYRELGVEK